ncbi:AAA family ATPase [Shewanella algae]|uniref:AAA family ATPase n=1 Tax=Shewanella algae TaxID=38313 RepID=UPI001BF0CABD|nr:AAA family ATPase [Shewanella algae]BCV39500.1 hypothetical protein TUM17378_07620 [Shewanella algae]
MSQNIFSEQLAEYINSGTACIFIQTSEDIRLDRLLEDMVETIGFHIIEWNLAYGWVDFGNKATNEAMNKVQSDGQILTLSQSLESLRHEELDYKLIVIKNAKSALEQDQYSRARLQFLINNIQRNHEGLCTVLLVSEYMQLPQEIEALTQVLPLPLPSRSEIGQQLKELALQHGLNFNSEQLPPVCNACAGLTQQQIRQVILQIKQKHSSLNSDAITAILQRKENLIRKSGVLEMIKANDSIDSLGGLEELKHWLRERAALIRQIDTLESRNIAVPKGVLIAGMPGCGKSLTAKVAAHLFQLPLLRLDMGSLLGKYVGESESNMRRALAMAESISPCVLWIDELEKAFTQTGGGNAASEVTSRLLGYFLTWMQEKSGAVFTIATANDITALPPELLRKGRFDEVFYVGFPNQEEREAILRVGLSKSQQNLEGLDLATLAAACRDYSGADIHNAINLALEQTVLSGHNEVTYEGLRASITATVPLSQSLSDKIHRYEELFEQFRLRSASRHVGNNLAQMKKWIDDPNYLRRRELAAHLDCPEAIHEKLINDSEESVIEAILTNPCCTGKILALVITQCCPAESHPEITGVRRGIYEKALDLVVKHPNVPVDLIEEMLKEKRLSATLNLWHSIKRNKSLTDEHRDSLLKVSPDLQHILATSDHRIDRLGIAGKSYLCQEVQIILTKDKEESVRKKLAENSSIHEKTQNALADDPESWVRRTLADIQGLYQSTQDILSQDREEAVRNDLARNTSISNETQTVLSKDYEKYVRSYLAENPAISDDTQDILSKDKEEYVRSALAENPAISDDTQNILSKDKEERVRSALAKNVVISTKTQNILSKDSEEYVRRSLAENTTISIETQDVLSNDIEEYVRTFLARNTAISHQTQNYLAIDKCNEVRESLAENINCLVDVQSLLVTDDDSTVRASLASNLNVTPEMQAKLAEDECSSVRQKIASNPNCLDTLHSILANDADKDVRESLAGNENCPDQLRISLFKDCRLPTKCRIARLSTDSVELQRLVAKDENSDVKLALAQNRNCLPAILDCLAHESDSDIREAVAKHQNTSIHAQRELFIDSKSYVRKALELNPNVSDEISEKLSSFSGLAESFREMDVSFKLSIAFFRETLDISKEEQNSIATDSSSDIREMLAGATQYPETQMILANDMRLSVRRALAENPKITNDVKNALLKEGIHIYSHY